MKRFPNFADYFNLLLKEKEPNALQEEVARKFRISQGALSKIKNGMMIPSDELAERFASEWEIDNFKEKVIEARREDTMKILQNAKPSRELDAEDVINLPTKPRLPITAAAGVLSDYLGGVLAHECEQIPVVRSIPNYDFTMIVKGNSMEPKYEGGDEIACKKVESLIEWGKTYVLATRDGAVLKRLYEAENGVRCVSYNKDEYPDFFVKGDDILGVYRVVGLIRI